MTLDITEIIRDCGSCAEWPWEMACPVCGCENVHLEKTASSENTGEIEKVLVTVPSVRGDILAVVFYCERGHRFSLNFSQHKGTEYVGVQRLSDELSYRMFEDTDA